MLIPRHADIIGSNGNKKKSSKLEYTYDGMPGILVGGDGSGWEARCNGFQSTTSLPRNLTEARVCVCVCVLLLATYGATMRDIAYKKIV